MFVNQVFIAAVFSTILQKCGGMNADQVVIMKKYLSLFFAIIACVYCIAQSPVTWAYSAKKISTGKYEVHLRANIQDGWHLYAQKQSKEFLGVPAKIKFNKHPLVTLSGKTSEIGDLEKSKDPILDIESEYYSNEVEFVQTVTVRNSVKTTISGTIEFQTCTKEKCLPPATVDFNVPIK